MGFAVLTFKTGWIRSEKSESKNITANLLLCCDSQEGLKEIKIFLLFCMVSRQPDHKSISTLHPESKSLAR